MASGLVLFILTLVVNIFASLIVRRSRSGQEFEIYTYGDRRHTDLVGPHRGRAAGARHPPARGRVRPAGCRRAGRSAGCGPCLVWLVFTVGPYGAGPVGFLVSSYAAFLAIYWLVVRELDGPVLAGDRLMAVVVGSAALAMVVPLVLILGYVVDQGPAPGADLAPVADPGASSSTCGCCHPGGAAHRHRRPLGATAAGLPDLGAAGLLVRDLPERDRRPAAAAGADLRRRHERRPPPSSPACSSTAFWGHQLWLLRLGATGAIAISEYSMLAGDRHPHLGGGAPAGGLTGFARRVAGAGRAASGGRPGGSSCPPPAGAAWSPAVILGVARAIGETAP